MTEGKPSARRLLGCVLAVLALLASTSGSAAASSSLFPSDEFVVWLHGVGTVPGRDYDQVVTSEAVDLDGIALVVYPDGDHFCTAVPALENGQTYTLLSTTGGLSGRLNRIGATLEEGDVYPHVLPLGRGCLHPLGDLEIHYHESGPVQTVTATVVNGSPIPVTRTSLEPDPWMVETNQLATFTATVFVSSGTASGVVSFEDPFGDNDAITCPDQHVVATADEPATAACQTTDSVQDDASRGGWGPSMTATFTPDDASQVGASDGPAWISVRSGATTTQLDPSPDAAPGGAPVDLVATVTPAYEGLFAPSGSVAFSEDGALPGCAAVPLSADGTAHCTATFAALGAHRLTASYVAPGPFVPGAAAAFLGSSSPAAIVVTAAAPPKAAAADPSVAPTLRSTHARRRRHTRRARCRRRRHRAHGRAHASHTRRCAHRRARHRSA